MFDPRTLQFDQPEFLWLLLAPATLVILWTWRFLVRGRDRRRLAHGRRLPVRERIGRAGVLLFWLGMIGAVTSVILALARPSARIAAVRTAGIDVVILQDGSASMRVKDVAGDRWQRSMAFLRVLAESLAWNDDRIALALFAHIAAPQVRLTRDPNTFFFFLDHLENAPPFRLEDDTTWDTNIELGIHWGLRLIEKDEELHGKSSNSAVFVLISDGEAWSGNVADALGGARARGVPVAVVGVGTIAGGVIPEPQARPGQPLVIASAPKRAELDRASLEMIASADSGQDLELDRQSDREIANTIIDGARRRARPQALEETTRPLYWPCLVGAGLCLCAGALLLKDRAHLGLVLTASLAALFLLFTLAQ